MCVCVCVCVNLKEIDTLPLYVDFMTKGYKY